jgi:GT2 family glycosyltransferase
MVPATILRIKVGREFSIDQRSLVRRDAFLQIGGFDERLSGYEDDDLFLPMFRAGWLNAFNPEATICYRRHFGSSAFSERMWLSREIFAEKLCDTYPDEPELVRFYIRDIIGPRFYSRAREEYWRHFPHRRWDLCMRSLDLMRHFSAMSKLSLRNRLRRSIGFSILARPALFEHLYPILRLLTPLPRFVMRPRSSASPEQPEKSPSSQSFDTHGVSRMAPTAWQLSMDGPVTARLYSR